MKMKAHAKPNSRVQHSRPPRSTTQLNGILEPFPFLLNGALVSTWTGRGLAPRWLSALEAKGKKREAFLIKR